MPDSAWVNAPRPVSTVPLPGEPTVPPPAGSTVPARAKSSKASRAAPQFDNFNNTLHTSSTGAPSGTSHGDARARSQPYIPSKLLKPAARPLFSPRPQPSPSAPLLPFLSSLDAMKLTGTPLGESSVNTRMNQPPPPLVEGVPRGSTRDPATSPHERSRVVPCSGMP